MKRSVLWGTAAVTASLGAGVGAAYLWSSFVDPSPSAQGTPTGPVVVTHSATPSTTPSPAPTPTPVPAQFDKSAHSVDDPSSQWIVANKIRPLEPLDFEPTDLEYLEGVPGGGDQQMRSEAAQALQDLYNDLDDAGLTLRVTTAYRSYGFQESLYNEYVSVWGLDSAESLVARPGYSEHQTGLSVDVFKSDACRLEECFADSDTYAWLESNAADYGYVVRYPDGKEDVTGYRFEPWHLRYVGVELATEMKETEVQTLEEFFDLPQAPAYEDS